MTYWDKVIDQNQMDSSLVSELSDLSYRSIGGKRQAPRSLKEGIVNIGTIPFELTPPPDAITKEMIMDYQKEREKPYKDPITGVEYKYIPSAFKLDMPDLMPTLVNDLNLGRPPTNEDVKNYRIERGRLNIRLTKAIKDMKDIEEQIKQSEELINFGRKKPYKKHGVVQYDPLKPAERTREQAKLADNQGALVLAQNDIKQLETDIEQARQNGIDASDIINQNKQIVYDKNKENKENVQKYYNELKSVNSDKLRNLEREPNESDIDFFTRMKNRETELYDTNLYQGKAELEQQNKFRLNLKTIIRKDDLVDNIIKSFTGEQIFQINKNFNGIKESFLDRYGFNNSNLTTNDVVEELVNALEKILNPITAYEIEKEDAITSAKALAQSTTDPDYEFGTENNAFYIGHRLNSKHLWLKIGKKASTKIVFFSTNLNQEGSFNQIRKQGYPQEERITYLFFNYLKLEEQVFNEILEGALDVNSLYDILERKFGLSPIEGIKSVKINNLTGSRRWGWGLSHPNEEIPTYAKFGNLEILLHKLFYKNILSLRYKSGHSIEGFKNTKVSDAFVEIIIKMYKDENIDSLVKNLSTTETGLYNSILYMAGLHKKFKANHKETLAELKERFKICEGEILSGNNNPEVVKELKELLLKLHHLNAISLQSIKKYLKQFN